MSSTQNFNVESLQNDSINDDNCPKRRISSRSIKRKKFDDELVDSMSTSYPKHQKISTEIAAEEPIVQNEVTPVAEIASKKVEKVNIPKPIPKKKGRKQSNYYQSLVNNNCWKPADDLALIINVQQTNDLKMVFEGVKFSCKFSYQEIESRWNALLYDQNTKSLSLAAIRQLHSDIFNLIQSKALFSDAEEALLMKIESRSQPTLEKFKELKMMNPDIFLPARTPKILHKHWCLLKHYNLLNDQTLQPIPRHESVVSFSEIEKVVQKEIEEEMKNPEFMNSDLSDDENALNEITLNISKCMKEIRMIENELPKYQALMDSITGMTPSDFDNQTYAVLRGSVVRYLMRSTEITLGRMTKDFSVDVNLSLEGPSSKISRLQAIITLQPTCEFIIYNTGKRPIYINSKPILSNNSAQISHNSLIELSSLKFIFKINQDLIIKMQKEFLQTSK